VASICIKKESSLYTVDTIVTGSADNNQVDPDDIVVTDEVKAGNTSIQHSSETILEKCFQCEMQEMNENYLQRGLALQVA